jgi:uncharacterized protein involved in response to NO
MAATPVAGDRATAGPAVLSLGFRPFFLVGAVWAVLALVLWLLSLWGRLVIPTAFDPMVWHIHEMLFGFVGAAIAGFVLTAIPNWTGRQPLQGWPLLGLVALWAAGRAAVTYSAVVGIVAAAVIDVAFLVVLAAIAAREIVVGENWRNLPIIAALALLALCNALFHAGLLRTELFEMRAATELGWRLGITVVIMLIALIGGRIIPNFTGNWLDKRGEERPPPFGPFDTLTLIVTGAALLYWSLAPAGPMVAEALAVAAIANVMRLVRWRGHRTFSEPLLWILHLGYAWLPIGLALLGASLMTTQVPQTAAIHALTAGLMAVMIVAVATRATLGHTGRPLHAGIGTAAIYALIIGSAIARVGGALWTPYYMEALALAGVLWGAAFGLFILLYGPLLILPDPRKQAGPPVPRQQDSRQEEPGRGPASQPQVRR